MNKYIVLQYTLFFKQRHCSIFHFCKHSFLALILARKNFYEKYTLARDTIPLD
jgi:hypothetical protein